MTQIVVGKTLGQGEDMEWCTKVWGIDVSVKLIMETAEVTVINLLLLLLLSSSSSSSPSSDQCTLCQCETRSAAVW
jgi:hypothetical protein